MRPAAASVALWSVVAVAAVAGGVTAVVVTGGGSSIRVLSPAEVEAELDVAGTPDDDEGVSGRSGESVGQTKSTVAGVVTVSCDGGRISADTVTPAAGWDFTGPFGGEGKAEVTFTTDQPTAHNGDGGDTLIVTYACDDGEVIWDTRFE